MTSRIQRARADVERGVRDLIDTAETRTGSFDDFERAAWNGLLDLGCSLVVLFLACRVRRQHPARYQHEGRVYVLGEQRTSELGTRFGKIPFTRPVGRQPDLVHFL